jgi:hypothetical protein
MQLICFIQLYSNIRVYLFTDPHSAVLRAGSRFPRVIRVARDDKLKRVIPIIFNISKFISLSLNYEML